MKTNYRNTDKKLYDNKLDRTDRLIYEEAGSSKKLIKAWVQGDSLTNVGGYKLGTKIALGTGGDDLALEGLADIFNHPSAYNVLPFKCYDTDDEKPQLTAFFLPSHKFSLLKEYVDKRGFTDYIRFKEYYKALRAKLTEKALVDECAEHCFTPREALIKHGDNVFDAVALSQRLMQVKVQGMGAKPQHIHLLWDKSAGNGRQKVTAFEDINSKLIVFEPPVADESGNIYNNLYVGGIDAIDMGTADSATNYDVSDFCIVIKKRTFGLEEQKYVAIYKDRPANIREAYEVAMKLLTWYNCKAILEYTKISIVQYFTEKGKSSLLMERPESVITGSTNNGRRRPTQKRLIGIPAIGNINILGHGLELISNFIADYWHTIDSEEMLEQLLNFTIAEKRKFDIIAAMICAEYADESLYGLSPKIMQTINNQWRDIGYYIDENGIKRHGVIPKR